MTRHRRRRTDGARILVVEDNEDFSLLMQLALQDAGYVVDCAACAEDALRMLQSQSYQLLISDYSLPGYSGLWLLHRAFEHRLMRPGRALMVTGDPEAPGVGDVAPVVPKPVNFDQFISRVRDVLGRGHDTPADVAA
jgi:DNA-binding response OmpR family regulator